MSLRCQNDVMSIWHGEPSLEDVATLSKDTLNHLMGIEITEITPTSLKGRMPVDARTWQPAGLLHGGASVAFAETLASFGGYMVVDRSRYAVVGQEINANHVKSVREGWVYGEATPLSIGRRSQVWDIRITNADGQLVCISRCTLAVLDLQQRA